MSKGSKGRRYEINHFPLNSTGFIRIISNIYVALTIVIHVYNRMLRYKSIFCVQDIFHSSAHVLLLQSHTLSYRLRFSSSYCLFSETRPGCKQKSAWSSRDSSLCCWFQRALTLTRHCRIHHMLPFTQTVSSAWIDYRDVSWRIQSILYIQNK